MTLRSSDPNDSPVIDLGLLTDPDGRDKRTLCDAVDLARRVASTGPLAGECDGEILPGSEIRSEDDLVRWFSTCIQTVCDPTSTCRMGSDGGAVVDPRLKVRGVDGLWIADASVMPSVPRGHPNAVVAMIANRLADWLIAGA